MNSATCLPAYRRLLALLLCFWIACLISSCRAGTVASWYGDECRGRTMANGRPFDPGRFTCASWFHPFGTRLRVRHGRRAVVVTVTDRGPARRLLKSRQLDLSHAAFAALADPAAGLLPVTVTLIQ